MQGQAVADRGRALQMIDRLQRQMRDVENDYLITGCYEALGRLRLVSLQLPIDLDDLAVVFFAVAGAGGVEEILVGGGG